MFKEAAKPVRIGTDGKTRSASETIFRESRKKKGQMTMSVRRGDIYYADLSPVVGSEQALLANVGLYWHQEYH